jgi:hypothetical protein
MIFFLKILVKGPYTLALHTVSFFEKERTTQPKTGNFFTNLSFFADFQEVLKFEQVEEKKIH